MIVFCHLLNDNSGSPVVLREAIRGLRESDAERVLFVGHQGRGVLETAEVPIHRYWYRRSGIRLVTLFTYAASQVALYRTLQRAELPSNALIYVNTLLPFGAALWGKRNGRRVVYHLHEVSIAPRLLQIFLVRLVELTAEHVIYVSEDHRCRLPVASVPSTVVPNPVPTYLAKRAFSTPYIPRRSGRFSVLMVASPRDFKGVPEFLELARRFKKRTGVVFVLVLNASQEELAGYGPLLRRPENIVLHASTDDPAKFYASADVLLNLSRTDQWIETFGMTLIEAMAFGLPVIAPPVGGPAEIVTDGQEGYLVDSRDLSLLEQRLLTLMEDATTVQYMSKAARKRAGDFTVERFGSELHSAIIERVVSCDILPKVDKK